MFQARPELHPAARTVELVCIATVITACAFKIMHWPGAAVLIIVGGCSLALFYFPFCYRTLPAPKQTDQLLWLTLMAGKALALVMIGMVFFIQHWPYGGFFLLAGTIACGAVALVAARVRYKHQRLDMYCDGLLARCVILGLLAWFIWATFQGLPR